MTDEYGEWETDPERMLWLPGASGSYMRGFSDARDAVEEWDKAVALSGLDPAGLRAIASTGAAGEGEVRMCVAPEHLRCLAWLVRYSLEANWGQHRVMS